MRPLQKAILHISVNDLTGVFSRLLVQTQLRVPAQLPQHDAHAERGAVPLPAAVHRVREGRPHRGLQEADGSV